MACSPGDPESANACVGRRCQQNGDLPDGPPAVDKDGVPLPPVVGKEGAQPVSAKDKSGHSGSTANCQPKAIDN